jgi:2-polyprenyl-3-methyl-5-hydroxy-6-metoxy-1,4-benzoquinol methylase
MDQRAAIASADTVPSCPITGQPAARLIQTVSSDLLIGLWKASFHVDAAAQLGTGRRFGLWESPCGLVFFDPMTAGDGGFYRALYSDWDEDGPWQQGQSARADYATAAALIKPADRVLDVGCGAGAFAGYVRHARYVGLDDNFPAVGVPAAGAAPPGASVEIRNESLREHRMANREAYDAVCAFHVIEHTPDIMEFARDLAGCLKPGGLLFLAVPKFPSPINEIPNFVFNAPPHHLSWWSESALRAVAAGLGLQVESLAGLPLGAHHRLGYWMGRSAPKLTGGLYFRHSYVWHGALLWSFVAGRLCSALLGTPRGAEPVELLMIARKPAVP